MNKKIVKFKKSADDILEENKGIFKHFMILGYDENGEPRVTYDGNLSDQDIIYLMEMFKVYLINED